MGARVSRVKSVADGGIDRSTKTVGRERGAASRRNDDAERDSERARRPFLVARLTGSSMGFTAADGL